MDAIAQILAVALALGGCDSLVEPPTIRLARPFPDIELEVGHHLNVRLSSHFDASSAAMSLQFDSAVLGSAVSATADGSTLTLNATAPGTASVVVWARSDGAHGSIHSPMRMGKSSEAR